MPCPGEVCLATATSEEVYDESSHEHDLSNQRRVLYLRGADGNELNVSREQLTEGLQRRLRVPGMAVADLYEFHEEIEKLFNEPTPGWSSRFQREVSQAERDFKEKLLQKIRSGQTNLKAGGVGLETVVKELLQLDGYEAEVLSKRTFPGFADADIRAVRGDRCAEVKLLVQVKHHAGQTDTWGAEQLTEIDKQMPKGEFSDYRLVLCTSGDAGKELQEMCEKQGIVLITGLDLVEWISQLLSRLKHDTRMKLGISNVPKFVL